MMRCWDKDASVRPTMGEIIETISFIQPFFPPAIDPLDFPDEDAATSDVNLKSDDKTSDDGLADLETLPSSCYESARDKLSSKDSEVDSGAAKPDPETPCAQPQPPEITPPTKLKPSVSFSSPLTQQQPTRTSSPGSAASGSSATSAASSGAAANQGRIFKYGFSFPGKSTLQTQDSTESQGGGLGMDRRPSIEITPPPISVYNPRVHPSQYQQQQHPNLINSTSMPQFQKVFV